MEILHPQLHQLEFFRGLEDKSSAAELKKDKKVYLFNINPLSLSLIVS